MGDDAVAPSSTDQTDKLPDILNNRSSKDFPFLIGQFVFIVAGTGSLLAISSTSSTSSVCGFGYLHHTVQ